MAMGTYRDLLKSGGFQSFLWTQSLGAFNDNVYKIIVSMLAVSAAARGGTYLSLAGAVFILPFFLFSGYAGHIADVYNKRKVLIVAKVFEIFAMGFGLWALIANRIELLLAVLFLVALQSTFFSPAKYGIVPEMLPEKDLSRANGLLEMSTFVAIILGTSLGSFLLAGWRDRPAALGLMLIGIAALGAIASLGIARVPNPVARKPWRMNPWGEIASGIRRLYSDKPLWLTVVGISYFWFLGAFLQMNIILFGKNTMGLDEVRIGILVTFLAMGIGLGSLAAGRLSGDKVELGLPPLGSLGMALFFLLLARSTSSYAAAATAMFLLGFSGGLFIVPLNAFLQLRSGTDERGQLIATNNFLNTVGTLVASGALWLCHDLLGWSPERIILFLGLLTLAATVYILKILPAFLVRFTLWMLTHLVYRIRIVGQENVLLRGPALLVGNHVSLVDGFLVGASMQRFIRFLIYRPYYESRGLRWLFRLMKAIPIAPGNREEVAQSIERARQELRDGHVVCIFAEGAVSRTGNLLRFRRGFERIVEDLDVPVIPIHLDRLWGSIFSFKGGQFFWKWPQWIPYPVTVSFGNPLPSTVTATEVRQAVQELGSDSVEHRRTSNDLLHLRFIQTAKRCWFSPCMADSTGKELTYGRALTGSLLLARHIRQLASADSMVGLLLPASVGGALANIAVLLAGKTPVNLNFTTGREAMQSAVEQCGIRRILTSRIFLDKAKLEPMEGMVYLEDLLREITPVQKIWMTAASVLLPSRLIRLLYDRTPRDPDSLATIIFSSGSTGAPKGVMLSHHNIISNIEAIAQVFWVTRKDRILGVLPFFHSFGFTVTLWLPLLAGFGAVYHPNPLDAKAVGELSLKYKTTLLTATPTFYAAYLRKCSAEQFASLRYALVGAERLREPLAEAFKEKYGLDLLEGYGATEMAPVVSVNIPDVEQGRERQKGLKRGTVGHPVPGVAVKVVDPETRRPLGANEEGLLLLKGPNRMLGYWRQPEKTAEVLDDGWYVSGDIGFLDDDGFLTITDRISRFSKIGGEMVPHIRIEEVVNQAQGDGTCVVTAVPDEQRGERLVVLYTHQGISPAELWERLSQAGLPKLWLPKRENIHHIEAIPTLGSGKTDLRRVQAMAAELEAAGSAR